MWVFNYRREPGRNKLTIALVFVLTVSYDYYIKSSSKTMEFLTQEEAIQVDAALLSSKEKFSTRLAIYALRCLKEISQTEDIVIENIKPEQVQNWVRNDSSFQENIEVDANFDSFFTQLLMASLNPLKQVSQTENIPIQELTVKQLIDWFEQESKKNLEQD